MEHRDRVHPGSVIDKVKFRKVKTRGEIDRRAVVNPAQARELLTAPTYAGRTHGQMMAAMFARMYFAGLRSADPPEQVASPPARRPYDLRHAAVSLWLNAGVHAPEVARRAGHGVDVPLKLYARCIDGQHETADKRILEALTT
ncbi:hypothetical protein [Streptosporangium carneum]|uniref:hypothetical protein n=1 Tax=Streptosporangium carneum TaxID=47481 RepID=UPI0022F340BD|nr:hypothetical protein [Streptosporangium carneum]